jgi:hypothetical protein
MKWVWMKWVRPILCIQTKKTSFLVYSDLPPEAIGTLASGVETAIDALLVRAGAQMAVFLPHIPFLGEHTPPTICC